MNPFEPFGVAVPQKYILPLKNPSGTQEFSFILTAQLNWLREVITLQKLPKNFPLHERLTEDEVFAFLSQRKRSPLGPNWDFVHVTYLRANGGVKTFRRVESLKVQNTSHEAKDNLDDFIGELSYRKVCNNPYISVLNLPEEAEEESNENLVECDEKAYTKALLNSVFYRPPEVEKNVNFNASPSKEAALRALQTDKLEISNLAHAVAVLQAQEHFLIFRHHIVHNIQDLVTFSPNKLASSNIKQLFLIYQILKFLRDVESLGIFLKDLGLKDFYIDEGLYLSVYPRISSVLNSLQFKRVPKPLVDPKIKGVVIAIVKRVRAWGNDPVELDFGTMQLIIRSWVEGLISNYEYIMFLNFLAGRYVNGNPNYHPIFPWVVDFQGGWRDLKKSKFRINKGERQLDLTYEECQNSGNTVPHHVTDLLSEITYYIYKARRTPKEVLCKFVRPKWVAAEYPVSISRMQEWTPDECIPEFYDDPTIFQSIHSDLPNLQIPNYCQNADDFIKYHRRALESDNVSSKVHHWIDLTFGYKLSGNAAVKSKNVYLGLVDGHTNLEKNGIVQLFQTPHPPRKSETRNKKNAVTFKELREMREIEKGEEASEASFIHLPKHYDPAGFLNDLEVCITFFKTHFSFPSPQNPPTSTLPEIKLKGIKDVNALSPHVQQFASFFLELLQGSRVRHTFSLTSYEEKFQFYQQTINLYNDSFPIFAKRVLQAIFHPQSLEFSIPIDICLDFFLNSRALSPLPFPPYFPSIYKMINSLRQMDLNLQNLSNTQNDELTKSTRVQFQEFKVKSFSKELISLLSNGELDEEGIQVIFPFVLELFSHPGTRVSAVWNLFCPLSRALGKEKAANSFLQPLIQIYEADYNSDKHLKLFHRSFFLQLMSCLGLETFLENFSTLIIEAVAIWPKGLTGEEEEEILREVSSAKCPRTHLKSKEILEVNIPTMKPSPKSIIPPKNYSRLESDASDGGNSSLPPEMFLMEPDLSDSESNSTSSQSGSQNQEMQGMESDEGTISEAVAKKLDMTIMRMKSASNDISEMCSESLIWLAHRLGPVLTAKYLTRNLLRMLTICYSGHLDLEFPENTTNELVCEGDTCARSVFECLIVISDLYGDAFIERQYLTYCVDVINSCFTRMSSALEAALIGVASLLEHVFRHMSDSLMVSILNETLVRSILRPILSIVCSKDFNLPSGTIPRSLLASKTIGMLKGIKKKIGPDLAMLSLKPLIDQLGSIFERIYSHTFEEEKEVSAVFGPQLAHQIYTSFCDLMSGSSYENILRDLYMKQGIDTLAQNESSPRHARTPERRLKAATQQSSSFGSRSFGNRIQIQDPPENAQSPEQPPKQIDRTRHLRGNWLLYWEHEVGISESNFNFKQIKLQTFTGHTAAIRSIYCLNNENSFLSASKDKTAKIYSLRNQGDENTVINANWTYKNHKRPVLSVIFNEELHLAASTDGSIHIWDPFVGKLVRILDKANKPICTLRNLENSCSFIGAGVDSSIHVVDPRTCKSFEMKIGIGQNSGLVRCMSVSHSEQIVSVGHSSGMISGLDIRNGSLLGSWKAHEGEVLKLVNYKDKYIISSAFDSAISVWNLDENKLAFNMKGATEPVHCLLLSQDNLITCTTSNRIGVYTKIDPYADFSLTRLRSDSFKGIVTSLNLLPLNQLILLGSDSGNISLLC